MEKQTSGCPERIDGNSIDYQAGEPQERAGDPDITNVDCENF
ncbi:MAG: hypothetical protein V1696_01185 [Candidatus Jorgensenbacteria bacterium]